MYFSTKLLFKLKIDDVVGAIPAHLVAGVWGTLAVPLTNGDVSFGAQFLGTISIVVFVFVVSLIVFQIMKATVGLRISKEAERLGTDKAEVGVSAYSYKRLKKISLSPPSFREIIYKAREIGPYLFSSHSFFIIYIWRNTKN